MTRTLPQLFRDCLNERQVQRTRLVTKEGHCNIEYGNVRNSSRLAYLLDIWSTILELPWAIVLFLFTAAFLLSFFICGLLWYWIARNNGDLWWQNPAPEYPCVIGVVGLTSAFLFSYTSQMTIGYSVRVITPYCPGAITFLVFQTLVATIVKCFWCGVVVAKMALPKKRAKTISFSHTAVICVKNNALCLQLRVANLRKTLMVGSQIYGKLLRTTVTPEGDTIILDQISIDFLVEAGEDTSFFIYPLTLYHVIDSNSPFYSMTADNFQYQEFELVVFLDGLDEATNFSCQVRTSYIPQEIMWGYEFFPIVSRSKEGSYCVDFSVFTRVVPVPTPHCASCCQNPKVHSYDSADVFDNPVFESSEIPYPDIHKSLNFRTVRKKS